jgi:hypothetical protein
VFGHAVVVLLDGKQTGEKFMDFLNISPFSPDDLDGVKKVQAGYKVQTLSAYRNQSSPPSVDFPKVDKELTKTNFFEYLDFCLQFLVYSREVSRLASAENHGLKF